MTFVGDLCIALGRGLPDVLAMSAAEFAFWRDYYTRRGFPADRIEAASAIAGTYLGNLWGGKREPSDLLPRFGGPKRQDMRVLAAQLASLPGAKVRRIPRPERKAKADHSRPDAPQRPPARVLNPKKG